MFTEFVNRTNTSTEWKKIPWHDSEFSRRMLAEHLSQIHDLASRRLETVDEHVQWIHRKVLNSQPASILDIGCGPGFYTRRFLELGHTCTGIDISPASIDHAREHDSQTTYHLGDVRTIDFGSDYALVSMIYGELNAFPPPDAAKIIAKAHGALKSGGKLLLEVHPYAFIHKLGQEPSTWHTAPEGLFADEPYLCLGESDFDLDRAISRYYVYLAESGEMQQYTAMHQGYTDDEYRQLLRDFAAVQFYPSLTGSAETENLFVIVAKK